MRDSKPSLITKILNFYETEISATNFQWITILKEEFAFILMMKKTYRLASGKNKFVMELLIARKVSRNLAITWYSKLFSNLFYAGDDECLCDGERKSEKPSSK